MISSSSKKKFLGQFGFFWYLLTLQLIDIDSSAVTPINWSTSWLWQIGASEKTNKNSIDVDYQNNVKAREFKQDKKEENSSFSEHEQKYF